MRILFSRQSGTTPMLTCIRDNRTTTWFLATNQSDFFVLNDLTRYAIETTLGYTQGFYGKIAAGQDIHELTLPIPQGQNSEFTYSNLLTSLLSPTEETLEEGLIEILQEACKERSLPPLNLHEDQLNTIRDQINNLLVAWKYLPAGEMLELSFPLHD